MTLKKKWILKLKSLVLLSLIFLIAVFYQNCAQPVGESRLTESSLSAQELTTQKAMRVLTTKCSSCHNANVTSGGVDVLNVDTLLASGAVVPSEPSLSPLFLAISSGSMPPAQALAQQDIQAISDWILSLK